MRAASLAALLALAAFASLKAQDATPVEGVLKDYAENAVAADAKYLGKTLAVSGTVDAVKKDDEGSYYLVLGPKEALYCYFESSQEAELGKMKKGDAISLRGVCKGEVKKGRKSRLLLVDCKLGLANAAAAQPQAAKSIKRSLVLLSGPKGSGSGFIARIGGVKYVVSNFHVFFENFPKILDSEDRSIEVKSIKFTPDRDLALFELADQNAYEALEIEPDVTALPTGSALRVYGNSGGGGVFTEIGGKSLGVGPAVIETDAQFIEGNSGSPVLEFPSLKVVGVATYASLSSGSWAAKGTRFEKVRRFATRIDNLDPAAFDTYEKASFDAEIAAFKKLKDFTMLKAATLANLSGLGSYQGKDSKDSPFWQDLLLYSGKTQDGAQRAKLIALVEQWNKEFSKFQEEIDAGQLHSPKRPGLDSSSPGSIQKLPFDELNRILFPNAPKPKLSYKYLSFQAEELQNASIVFQERFKSRFEELKATFRK